MVKRIVCTILSAVFACSFIVGSVFGYAEDSLSLNLPASLVEIGEDAFAGSAAQRVVLPDGCISIGSRAFADCDNLRYIEIPESVVHIARDAFEGSEQICILCAPNSTAAFCAELYNIPWRDINSKDDILVAEIILETDRISLETGESAALKAEVLPKNATNQELSWFSSNPNIAKVSDGIVTAAAPGLAVITASAADGSGISAACIVEILPDTNTIAFSNVNAGASSSNAYFYAKASSEVSGKFTAMGLRIWKDDGSLIADYEKSISGSAKTSHTVWFDVFDDSGITLEGETDYICQMYVDFAGTTSWTEFIPLHTGVAMAVDDSLGRKAMVSNLQNCSSSSIVPSAKKLAMVTMAEELLDEGYEPAFVAGVLANIYYEGSFGKFESSKYSSGEPAYLVYMDENYDYRNKYSNKLIYNGISLSELDAMLDELAALGYPGKFGLGSVQWTGGRTRKLVDLYIEETAGSDTITLDQVVAGEVRMIKNELAGSYKYIHTRWNTAYTADLYSDDAVFSAGYRVCVSYEVPSSYRSKAITRGKKAMEIYQVMMGL